MSPKSRLVRKERGRASRENWTLARDIVLTLILREKPDWVPGSAIDEKDREHIARAVNHKYGAAGKSLVSQESWSGMVGAALSASPDDGVSQRFRFLTGKAA